MSAYLVSSEHVDVLIAGAKQFTGPGTFSWHSWPGLIRAELSSWNGDDSAEDMRFNPDTLGRELWAENLRSINERYPDTIDNPGSVPGSGDDVYDVLAYTYGPGARVLDVDPLGLLGAIRGYRYQACETGEAYYASVAEGFCRALESKVVDYLIDRAGANAWTVDRAADLAGETRISNNGKGSWSIGFTPGESGAVSISDMIARGKR